MKVLGKQMGSLRTSFSDARVWALAFGLSSLALTGCGNQKPFIEGVRLTTANQDGDLYAEMQADLNTGNIQLPAIDLPISHPALGDGVAGTLSLRPRLSGGTELGVGVNVTTLASLPPLMEPKLPNGTDLPIAGIEELDLIALPIDGTQVITYFAVDPGHMIFGAAIPIKEADSIGSYVPGTNLFYGYSFPNDIRAVGGLFTGKESGQTGIALFVDLSSVVNAGPKMSGEVAILTAPYSTAKPVEFSVPKVSSAKKNKLLFKLMEFNSSKKRVHLH